MVKFKNYLSSGSTEGLAAGGLSSFNNITELGDYKVYFQTWNQVDEDPFVNFDLYKKGKKKDEYIVAAGTVTFPDEDSNILSGEVWNLVLGEKGKFAPVDILLEGTPEEAVRQILKSCVLAGILEESDIPT